MQISNSLHSHQLLVMANDKPVGHFLDITKDPIDPSKLTDAAKREYDKAKGALPITIYYNGQVVQTIFGDHRAITILYGHRDPTRNYISRYVYAMDKQGNPLPGRFRITCGKEDLNMVQHTVRLAQKKADIVVNTLN